jgi:leucyl/phenylalanyl-tRNA---protein transferase
MHTLVDVQVLSDILKLYVQGYFPLGLEDGIGWFDQRAYGTIQRALMPLDERFHVPRSLQRVLKTNHFDIRINQDFATVLDGCATRGWSYKSDTWITPEIERFYLRLHRVGYAHSFETWQDGQLVGGIMGVAIGGVFVGDSMFYAVPEASKVAMVRLVEYLRARGFAMFDVQVQNPHLKRFGAYEVEPAQFRQLIREAVKIPSRFVEMSPTPGKTVRF